MRKIIVDLNRVKDDEYAAMYEIFGLDVLNKSYEDFERRKIGNITFLLVRNGSLS